MDKIKNYLILFLILLVALTTSWLEVSKHEYNNLQRDIKISHDSTIHYKNKYGQTVADSKVMEVDNMDLKASLSSLGFQNDALKEQVGNLKRLVSAYQGRVNISGTVNTVTKDSIVTVPGKDNIIYKDFNFHTKYLHFEGYFKPSTDTLLAKYTYSSPLLITLNETRKGIDAKASFEDPAARINDQKVVFVQRKKRFYEKGWFKFGVGAVAGIYISNKLK